MSTFSARSGSTQKVTKTGLVPVLDDAAWLARFNQSRKAAPPAPVVVLRASPPVALADEIERQNRLRDLDDKITHSTELLQRLVNALEVAKDELVGVQSALDTMQSQVEVRASETFSRLSDIEERLRKRAESLGQSVVDDVSFSEIIATVATQTGVPIRDLKSGRRTDITVFARHIVSWLGVNCTPLSLPAIGLRMNRDHTSILHGARLVDRVASLEGITMEIEPTGAEIREIVSRLFRSDKWATARHYNNKNLGKRRRWQASQGKIAP